MWHEFIYLMLADSKSIQDIVRFMYQMYVWNNRAETCAIKINMYFCVNCDCFVNIHVIMKLATNRIMQRSHLKTLCFCVIWYKMCVVLYGTTCVQIIIIIGFFLFPLQHMGIYLVNWNLAISQSHSLSEIDRERKEQPNAPISLSPKIGDRCKGIYIIPLARTFLALAGLKTHASSLRLSTAYAVLKTNPYMPVCVAARSKHWPQRRHRCFMCLGC
jgi:hypothetical protein